MVNLKLFNLPERFDVRVWVGLVYSEIFFNGLELEVEFSGVLCKLLRSIRPVYQPQSSGVEDHPGLD